jgi:hypothetical protein
MQSEIFETLRNLYALADKNCELETVSEIVNRVLAGEGKPQEASCRFVDRDDEIQLT